MFGLNYGEWFIVVFVTVMVGSARYWPAIGERIAVGLNGSAAAPAAGQKPAGDDAPRE